MPQNRLLNRCLTALLLLALSTMACAEDRVAVATLLWEPYVTTNTLNGGVATEIVTKAFRLGGVQAEVMHMPWKDAIEKTEKGIYQAIYPAYFSLDRAGKFLISEPFLCSPVVLVARAGSAISYNGLSSLEPYRIGVVAGYANAEAFDDATHLKKITNSSDLDNLQKLKAGVIDLAASDKLVAMSLIRNHPDILGSLEDYRFMSPPLGNRDMYVMFPKQLKGSKRRLKRFNKGLKKLRDDGGMESIIHTHGFR